jgi:hypothetical protein
MWYADFAEKMLAFGWNFGEFSSVGENAKNDSFRTFLQCYAPQFSSKIKQILEVLYCHSRVNGIGKNRLTLLSMWKNNCIPMSSDTLIFYLALNAVWKSVQFRYPECAQLQTLYPGGASVLATREKKILGMTTMHWNHREMYPPPHL